jgi:hypothetical protein
MINRKLRFLITAVLLLTLTACATTELTGSFKDEGIAGKKFQHILIIGAAKQPDIRKQFEDEFVRQLQVQNVKAVPSYKILSAEQMLDRNAISSKISDLGVDSVLVTRLTELKKKREAYTGSTYRIPYAYYSQMQDYYKKGFEESGGQSPLTTHKEITLETNIYSAETEKLAWATASDVKVQDKVSKLTEGFIKAVVKKMLSDKVI